MVSILPGHPLETSCRAGASGGADLAQDISHYRVSGICQRVDHVKMVFAGSNAPRAVPCFRQPTRLIEKSRSFAGANPDMNGYLYPIFHKDGAFSLGFLGCETKI